MIALLVVMSMSHQNLFYSLINHELPRVQAIPLGIILRVASPFVAPAKISPEKVSPIIRVGAILDLENSLGIKRIRGFSQE